MSEKRESNRYFSKKPKLERGQAERPNEYQEFEKEGNQHRSQSLKKPVSKELYNRMKKKGDIYGVDSLDLERKLQTSKQLTK